MLTKSSYVFFLTNQNSSASFRVRYHLSVLRAWDLVDTTPSTDEHLILYFSIDSSTVRTRLEGGAGRHETWMLGVEETRGQM